MLKHPCLIQSKMKPVSQVKITDITKNKGYERYLYRRFAPIPFRKYSRRQEYLENSIPKGFHKKLLIFGEQVVGQIEYAPQRHPIVQ